LLFICIITIASKTHAAGENEKMERDTAITIRKPSSPYCGVYCLYTAMKLDGKEVNFIDLVKQEYIGSRLGSSLAELKKAAEDYGLCAIAAGNVTCADLGHLAHSAILHVRSDGTSEGYDHYELLLGTDKDQARLFDPPGPVRLVPFRELAPRWDGNALIVSSEPIDLGTVFAPALRRLIIYAVIVILVIFALHWVKRWLPQAMLNSRGKLFGLSIGQGAAFTIVALLCGMLYHFANDAGLLANANATTSIQQAHVANFIPKINERKVHKLLDSETVFIDARLSRDYKAGHIKGAISVPVNTNDVERQKVTADIPKDSRIVMYCQSSGCKYAEIVAIKLIDDGYSNISIYKGGWAEWVAKNGKPKEAAL
jgi:rhodanese-related sulfurtransferase